MGLPTSRLQHAKASEKGQEYIMKSLGIVRKVDELGRIVLPKESRTSFELEPGDGVEIFVEKDKIILQKYAPSCIFCGEADDIVMFKNKRVCRACLEELTK